ncbi:MAG: GGDEF domain-containing protein [Candidatus Micrarchaeia archaeon]
MKYRLHRLQSSPRIPSIRPGDPLCENILSGIKVVGVPGIVMPGDPTPDYHTAMALFNIGRMVSENFPTFGHYTARLMGEFEDLSTCAVHIIPQARPGGTQKTQLEHRLTISREGDLMSLDEGAASSILENDRELKARVRRVFDLKKPTIFDYTLGIKLIFDNLDMNSRSGTILQIGDSERHARKGHLAIMPFYYRDPVSPSGIVIFQGDLSCRGTKVLGALRTIWSSFAAMEAASQMSFMLTHKFDAITILTKAADFKEDLKESIRQLVERKVKEIYLLTIDIDHFKDVNDRYGHPIGNEVLRNVAEAIKASVRTVDTASRVGGEEFAVIARGVANRQEAMAIAERIRYNVSETRVETTQGTIRVQCSIGVARVDDIATNVLMSMGPGKVNDSVLTAICHLSEKASDDGLLRAKSEGRNRVVVVDPPRLTPQF